MANSIKWIRFAGHVGVTLTYLGIAADVVSTVASGDYSVGNLGAHGASVALATYSLFAGPFAPLAGAAAAVGNAGAWGIEAWANHLYQAEVETNRQIVVQSTMKKIPELMEELQRAYDDQARLNSRLTFGSTVIIPN